MMKVRPFSSAKTEDMHDYIRPTKRDFDPNIFILHVGTNNCRDSGILKTEDNNVALSEIVPRGDKLNEKVEEVNNLLEEPCNQKQMRLIKHSNINTKRHLNRSK